MRFNIQWQNKYSKETGYVGKVMYKAGYFVNTFEQAEAKKYKSQKDAEKDVEKLNEIGEGDNNTFSIVAFE